MSAGDILEMGCTFRCRREMQSPGRSQRSCVGLGVRAAALLRRIARQRAEAIRFEPSAVLAMTLHALAGVGANVERQRSVRGAGKAGEDRLDGVED
jgi:hypothetical protein